MMQSLLLNGAASIKSNDLKNQDENDTRINSLKSSKLAEQQKSFAKVMQDNIDKENARAQSRDAARAQEASNDRRLESTKSREQNKIIDDKKVNEAKPSEKVNSSKQDEKLTSADSKKVNKDEASDDDKKIAKSDKNETKSDEIKSNTSIELSELELPELELDADVSLEDLSDSELLEHLNAKLNTEESSENNIELDDSELLEQLNAKLNIEESSENNVELDDSEIKLTQQSDSEIELVDSELTVMNTNPVDLSTAVQQNELVITEDVEETEKDEETLQDITPDSALDPMGQSSLLSQIEAAQQADTNVKSKAGDDSSEITMSMLKSQSNLVSGDEKKAQSLSDEITVNPDSDSEGEIDVKAKLVSEVEAGLKAKTGAELEAKVDAEAEKKPKIKLEADVNVTKEAENIESDSNLDTALQSLKPTEKLDQLSSLIKNETAVTNQTAVDVNGTRPNQTNQVQLDKLVAFNQQTPAANNLLQAPLDIQSKHAAAMMGERVMMMMSQGKQEVEIRLDPAELGSMLIKMQVKQDQVQLHIQTQAGLSKDIIEQNMPRLREQLAQQGIQLSEANVQQQSQQQSQQQRQAQQVSGSSRQMTNAQEVVNDQKNVFIPSKIPSLEQGIDYYV